TTEKCPGSAASLGLYGRFPTKRRPGIETMISQYGRSAKQLRLRPKACCPRQGLANHWPTLALVLDPFFTKSQPEFSNGCRIRHARRRRLDHHGRPRSLRAHPNAPHAGVLR